MTMARGMKMHVVQGFQPAAASINEHDLHGLSEGGAFSLRGCRAVG
jgi:hypothetical protein